MKYCFQISIQSPSAIIDKRNNLRTPLHMFVMFETVKSIWMHTVCLQCSGIYLDECACLKVVA